MTAAPLPLREADRKRPVLAHCSVCCSVSQQPDNMEVTALCLRLVPTVMVLLCARDQTLDAAVFHVVPNKLQFFEYEVITFRCEGDDVSSRWKVVHKFKDTLTSCNTSNGETTPTGLICTVKDSYPGDSGEYWCESGWRRRTNSVHIVITDDVILESPALPLMEGDDVTLRCRNKNNSSQPPADFYKDGRLIWSSPTREMTIHKLSLADEGLYKCSISGSGESPGSRLVITEKPTETNTLSSIHIPWIVVTVLLVVLLVVVGQHLVKNCWHRVSVGTSPADTSTVTYAAVSINRMKKANTPSPSDEHESLSRPVYSTLGPGGTQQLAEPGYSLTAVSVPPAAASQPFREDAFYSMIQ